MDLRLTDTQERWTSQNKAIWLGSLDTFKIRMPRKVGSLPRVVCGT